MFRLFQSSTRQIRIFPAATNVGRSTINAITTSTRWLSSSSSSSSSSSENILKVAIVGSGPSGCYTAKYLQSALAKQNRPATLAIIERLPIPYGLVRHGVAPDHPEVKNAQHDFANLFTSELNDDSSNIPIQLYANVQVGQAVSLSELRHLYDVVVLAYGCESDRKLGIPGEDSLQGVLSAREFVAWYNGHVDYLHIGQQVKDALLLSKEKNTTNTTDTTNTNIVVIGQGNVALDCARILAKTKASLLDTDLASHALPILLDHPSEDAGDGEQPPQPPSRTIHVVGRRGHVQGAFTIKELRELTKLEDECGVGFHVRQEELEQGATPASLEELKAERPKVRINKLLQDAASQTPSVSSKNLPTRVNLRFLCNPIRFQADESDPSKLGSVVCERTRLEGEPGAQRAVGTGEEETLQAQLALVSIGYKGVAIEGSERWFDESRGVMKNQHGLVDAANSELNMGGLYVSGWLKRGPSGIIGTNIGDAKDTVATILKDLEEESSSVPTRKAIKATSDTTTLDELLKKRNVQVVDWTAFEKIEAAETSNARKRSPEQPREKITTRDELLAIASS